MSDVRCPSCGDVFRIPDVPLPDHAMAACPWCGNHLPSSGLRKALPPLAVVVDSDGRPLTAVWSGPASQAFAASESPGATTVPGFEDFSAVADSPDNNPFPRHDDLPADGTPAAADFLSPGLSGSVSDAGWETDEQLADEDWAEDELTNTEVASTERDPDALLGDPDDEAELEFGSSQLPRPLENVSSFQFGEQNAPMPYPTPYARPKQPKSFAPLKTLFGIVLGGLLAVPLAGIVLALMGRPLDLGFWPFLGSADPPYSSRVASQPMEPRQRPRPNGRSMLTDDGSNPLATADDDAESIRPIFPTTTPDETAAVRIEPEVPEPILIFPDDKPESSVNGADTSADDELALPPLPDLDAPAAVPMSESIDPADPSATAPSDPGPSATEPATTPAAPGLTLPPPVELPAEPSSETELPSPEPPVALTPPAMDDPVAAAEPALIELTQPAEPAQPAPPVLTESPAQPDRSADMPVVRISAESSDSTDTGSKPQTASAIAETSGGSTPAAAAIPARLKPVMDEINTARERLFALEDSDDPVTLRRRWAELYVGLAKLAMVATPADRIPLVNLSKQLSDDELIEALSRMSPNWLRIGNRPSEGILLVGTIEQSEGKSFIRWGEDSAVELRGIDETVAGTSGQVFALGKILSSGSQAVVEITFARPLDR